MAALVIGSTLLWLMDGQKRLPISYAHGLIGVLAVAVSAVVFTSLGAMLASRLQRNPIGWMLLAIGMTFALLTPVNLAIQRAFEVARPFPPFTLLAAWLLSSTMTPLIASFVLIVCMVFPDGRFLHGRWWLGGALAVIAAILLAASSALEPSGLIWYPTVPNPAALPMSYGPIVGGLRVAALVVLNISTIVAAAAVWVRYRHADPRVQAQLRWILVGVVTMTAGVLPLLIGRYALRLSEPIGEGLIGLAAAAVCMFPLTVALAIVRQRLFDIDQLITRTLVYIPLMGICAGVYTASVTLFQRIIVSLTNDTSDAAIVFSALILASVFAPIRSALEVRVNRHFRPQRPTDEGGPVTALDAGGAKGEPMPHLPASLGAPDPRTRAAGIERSRRALERAMEPDIGARIVELEASLQELRRMEIDRRTAQRPSAGEARPPA
jgi:hypothetical protein